MKPTFTEAVGIGPTYAGSGEKKVTVSLLAVQLNNVSFTSMRCTGFNYLKREMLKSAALKAFLCFLRAQSSCVNLAAFSYDLCF